MFKRTKEVQWEMMDRSGQAMRKMANVSPMGTRVGFGFLACVKWKIWVDFPKKRTRSHVKRKLPLGQIVAGSRGGERRT